MLDLRNAVLANVRCECIKLKNFAPRTTADTVLLAAERTLMLGRCDSLRHWGSDSLGLDARL